MGSDVFTTIGITQPDEWTTSEREAGMICRFLESGAINLFHIRKLESRKDYTISLLKAIPQTYRPMLVLHSHFELANDFQLGGIHHRKEISKKSLQALASSGWNISATCHSAEEILNLSTLSYSYCFLSPIFDSISKKGYTSRFSLEDINLKEINRTRQVIALGGVIPKYFQQLYDAKFAGAALLGYLWSPKTSSEDKIRALIDARKNILNIK